MKGRLSVAWTPAELEALKGGVRVIPGRTAGAVRTMRHRCKVLVGADRAYTADEIAALRAGARTLPGRAYGAVFQKRKLLGLTGKRAPLWTPEEHALVMAGAMSVPGRSYNAVIVRRYEHGVEHGGLRERRPAEAQVRAAPIELAPVKAIAPRPWTPPPDPGRALIERLYALVGVRDPGLRQEIVSEAAVMILGQGMALEAAVAEATRAVRRFHGFRHVALDTVVWL